MIKIHGNSRTLTAFLVIILFRITGCPAGYCQSEEVLANQDNLVVQNGDMLRIEVDRFPEYDGDFRVSRSGEIDHPLLGDVEVSGNTIDEVKAILFQEFSRYIKRPEIDVRFASPVGSELARSKQEGIYQVFLLGEAKTVGSFDVTEGTRLLQLIALAGGPILHPLSDSNGNVISTGGDISRVSIFRSDGETQTVNLESLYETGDQSQNLVLHSGDTVYIPPGNTDHFTVLGDVRVPGSYPVQESTNLMEALASAGGFAPNGSLLKIRITRTRDSDPRTFHVNLWKILKEGRLEEIPLIYPGDVVFVGKTPFYHFQRFVEAIRGGAISTESLRVIRDFEEQSTATVNLR